MINKITGVTTSEYINDERRAYSLYVMQNRSIPSVADGLKAGGRRALWVARDGHKYKTATLAGATMPLHPHAECTGAINTLAAPYGNNSPLFKGDGAFGTLLHPTSYGAARYTSVTVSPFAAEVLFKDIEIVPMVENYDGTLMEPVHFLPLVPLVLVNPSEGIAVGFATNILPRNPLDVISAQINYLNGSSKKIMINPWFGPINQAAVSVNQEKGSFTFHGKIDKKDATTVIITDLPYKQSHENVIKKIDALYESGEVVDYTDRSKNKISIEVKFKKGVLSKLSDVDVLKKLALISSETENLNVLDFDHQRVWSTNPGDLIRDFTDWRLCWFVIRYQRLLDIANKDLSRYMDIKLAIDNKTGTKVTSLQSRVELKEFLEKIGVVNLDYIADLQIYRFSKEEYEKNNQRIAETLALIDDYNDIISSRDRQVSIYVSELKDVAAKIKSGKI